MKDEKYFELSIRDIRERVLGTPEFRGSHEDRKLDSNEHRLYACTYNWKSDDPCTRIYATCRMYLVS